MEVRIQMWAVVFPDGNIVTGSDMPTQNLLTVMELGLLLLTPISGAYEE